MHLSTTKPVYVLAVGPFGETTGPALRELIADAVLTRCTPDFINPSYWPDARMHLVVASRPVPQLMKLVNLMAYAWRTPFIPAVIEGSELVIGPVIVPGLSACYDCYDRRVLQHCARPEARIALMRHYEANAGSGPLGYLAVFADLAAVRLAQLAREAENSPYQVAGKIWQFDLMRRQSQTSAAVGVHGCRHCGLQRDERTRTYEMLQADLASLWQFNRDLDRPSVLGLPRGAREVTV